MGISCIIIVLKEDNLRKCRLSRRKHLGPKTSTALNKVKKAQNDKNIVYFIMQARNMWEKAPKTTANWSCFYQQISKGIDKNFSGKRCVCDTLKCYGGLAEFVETPAMKGRHQLQG